MSMYDQFGTNKDLEQRGIVLLYDGFRVTVARAGGSNKKYIKMLESKTTPHRRAIAAGTFDSGRAENILLEVFSLTVILNWEIEEKEDKWVKGIEGVDGQKLPFSSANVAKTLESLPDLFMDIKEQSENSALFRDIIKEEMAKN